MAMIEVKCPKCGSTKVINHGKTQTGYPKCYCQNAECDIKSFQLEHSYRGCSHEVETQIIEMTSNASGIRDISLVLKASTYNIVAKDVKTIF